MVWWLRSAGVGADAADRPAFPQLRAVAISECASHAVVDVAMGGVAGKGAGEQSLARKLYPRLVPVPGLPRAQGQVSRRW